MGLREWWRRRAARGGEEEREPDAATILVSPERGSEDATMMVDAAAFDDGAPGSVTEAIPHLGGAPRGRAAPVSPGLAPTRVEGAALSLRARVVGVVVAVEGEFEGRAFPLFEGTNRMGREHVCEICLPSERVAPQHLYIEYRSGFFRLERIAEPEVRVNFEPVAGTLLRDGDTIQIGMTTFRFRSIVGA